MVRGVAPLLLDLALRPVGVHAFLHGPQRAHDDLLHEEAAPGQGHARRREEEPRGDLFSELLDRLHREWSSERSIATAGRLAAGREDERVVQAAAAAEVEEEAVAA